MPTNYTPNYQLSQWKRPDKVLMDDFNADNAKIEAALSALAAADRAEADAWTEAVQAEVNARTSADSALSASLTAHTAELSRRGNCQVYTTTYVGNGLYGVDNPISLSFPRRPVLIVITRVDYGATVIMMQGCTHVMHVEGNQGACHLTWQGNSVKWFSADGALAQMSEESRTYKVVALFDMS